MMQGRPVQGIFCLMTPPKKAISLMRTCALEAVGLCKSTVFPLLAQKPVQLWVNFGIMFTRLLVGTYTDSYV